MEAKALSRPRIDEALAAWRAPLEGRVGEVIDAFVDSMAAAGYPEARIVSFRGYSTSRRFFRGRAVSQLAYWLPPIGVGMFPYLLVEKRAFAIHDGSYQRPRVYWDAERDSVLEGEPDYLYRPDGFYARLGRYLSANRVAWLSDVPHPRRPGDDDYS